MLILGIDTSTAQVSVAIGDGVTVLGTVQLSGGRRHAEQLAPAIDSLRRELQIDLGHLAAIAVGTGPGLFTGLRVGVTTAKVMAQALRIPVVGVPSLDLVAYPLRHADRQIVAVLDARRREVFAARYLPVPGGVQRVSDYAVHVPAELVADLAADRTVSARGLLLAGDGVDRFRAEFETLEHAEFAGSEFGAPSIAALVQLATARYEREEFEQPDALEPLYLRQSDAEIEWNRKAGVA
ncbi:MAG: tRNA threonylcarbamoyladenosine biosynthesis protein TsaB [Actinomycetota bacterium]|nr:tRNA threonylcarbamoyladenosine biosynthesis protein TsaB [Actinomycetota bacterium]